MSLIIATDTDKKREQIENTNSRPVTDAVTVTFTAAITAKATAMALKISRSRDQRQSERDLVLDFTLSGGFNQRWPP